MTSKRGSPPVRAEQQDGPQLAAESPQAASEDQLPADEDPARLPLHGDHRLRPHLPLPLGQRALGGVGGGRGGQGEDGQQGGGVRLDRRPGRGLP